MSSLDKATQGQMGDDPLKPGKAEHIDDVDDIEKIGMADTITDVATSADNIPLVGLCGSLPPLHQWPASFLVTTPV